MRSKLILITDYCFILFITINCFRATEDEMTRIFNVLSLKHRNRNLDLTREIDILQKKSDSLDDKLKALRAENLKELRKTEMQLKSIQMELDEIRRSSVIAINTII